MLSPCAGSGQRRDRDVPVRAQAAGAAAGAAVLGPARHDQVSQARRTCDPSDQGRGVLPRAPGGRDGAAGGAAAERRAAAEEARSAGHPGLRAEEGSVQGAGGHTYTFPQAAGQYGHLAARSGLANQKAELQKEQICMGSMFAGEILAIFPRW